MNIPWNDGSAGVFSTDAASERPTLGERQASRGEHKPGSASQVPGLRRADRGAGAPDRRDGEVLRDPAGPGPVPALSEAEGHRTLASRRVIVVSPDCVPGRSGTPTPAARHAAIGIPPAHETIVRLGLMAAGFTRPERDLFMAAWERAQGDLTPAELMLLQRYYNHAARDLGDSL